MFSDLTAGDSTEWTSTHSTYSASDGWALRAVFRSSRGDSVEVSGTGSGTSWTFALTPEKSASFFEGTWAYAILASKAGERATVETGSVRIKPDPLAKDAATTLREQIAAIDKAITARLAGGVVESFSIRGQSINRLTLPQLHQLRNDLAARLKVRRASARERNGLAGYSSLLRFS